MSGGNQCWETPDDLFRMLDAEFGFDIDVACSEDNRKCNFGITNVDSNRLGALSPDCDWFFDMTKWGGVLPNAAWCNPPYCAPLPWILKASIDTQEAGKTAVMLLNNDPSTKWYQEALTRASEIRILTGKRIQFNAPEGVKASTNNKAQIILVFRRKIESAPCHVWHWDWSKDLVEFNKEDVK